MRDTFPCPKCRRILKCTNVITPPGEDIQLDVFSCDDCKGTWRVGETDFVMDFTFVVGPNGEPLDAETYFPLPDFPSK